MGLRHLAVVGGGAKNNLYFFLFFFLSFFFSFSFFLLSPPPLPLLFFLLNFRMIPCVFSISLGSETPPLVAMFAEWFKDVWCDCKNHSIDVLTSHRHLIITSNGCHRIIKEQNGKIISNDYHTRVLKFILEMKERKNSFVKWRYRSSEVADGVC